LICAGVCCKNFNHHFTPSLLSYIENTATEMLQCTTPLQLSVQHTFQPILSTKAYNNTATHNQSWQILVHHFHKFTFFAPVVISSSVSYLSQSFSNWHLSLL
jgi:hypothetical protein